MEQSNSLQKPEIIDEMKPLKDYLLGKSDTVEFVEKCKEIRTTEDIPCEIIQPKQIENGNE